MLKKELIWREISTKVLNEKIYQFQQKSIAEQFSISVSTVFNALRGLRDVGAIKVGSRSFSITDIEKILTFWATHRKLEHDIIYSTHVDARAREVESSMPPGVVFGAYTAYRMHFKDVPADYDKVYVYSSDKAGIEKRFPKLKGYENLFVLKADPHLAHYGSITPAAQIYVDLWNLKDWYATDFLNALKKRLFTSA